MLIVVAFIPVALALECPSGTVEHVAATVDGRVAWCSRADGTWQGPSARWYPDGRPAVNGWYVDGKPDGTWTIHHANGRISRTGQMVAGKPDGRWTSWSTQGTQTGTVEHGSVEVLDEPLADTPDDLRVRWVTDLEGPVIALLPAGDEVVVATPGGVGGVDLAEGGRTWLVSDREPPLPWVELAGSQVAWATASGRVHLVQPNEGRRRTIPTGLPLADLVGSWPDVVVVMDRQGRLAGFEPETGELLWRGGAVADPVRPAVTAALAVVSGDQELRAFEPATGKVTWRRKTTSLPRALVADEERVYALGADGTVSACSLSDGRPRWSHPIEAAQTGTLSALRLEGGRLLVLAGQRVELLELRDGARVAGVTVPEGATADLYGGLACATRGDDLTCGLPEKADQRPDWTLTLGPVSGPPLLMGDLVVVPGREGLLWGVDPAVARIVSGTGAVEVRRTANLVDVVVAPVDATWGLVPSIAVPEVEVERPSPDGRCQVRSTILDLSGLPSEERLRRRVTSGAVGGEPSPDDALPVLLVAVPFIERSWTSSEDDWTFHPAWDADLLSSYWEVEYRHRWAPHVLSLWADPGTPEVAAQLEQLQSCTLAGASFRGAMVVQDGPVQRRFEGRLQIRAEGEVLDGDPGCLLVATLGGEPIGAWSPPQIQGWMDLTVRGLGEPEVPDLPDSDEIGVPAGVIGGAVEIHTLVPGTSDWSTAHLEGPVRLEVQGGDPDLLRAVTDGPELWAVPVPDLRYAEVERGRPVVHNTQEWQLSGRALPPAASPYLELWSSVSCPEEPSAGGGG